MTIGPTHKLAKAATSSTFRRWLWVRLVPRPDLNMVHAALRLTLEHPLAKNDPNALAMEHLADRLWDESVRRKN